MDYKEHSGDGRTEMDQRENNLIFRLGPGVLLAGFLVLLTLVLGGRSTAAPGYSQEAPGPLSKAHAALEGAANCRKCHGEDNAIIAERCLSCHAPAAARIAARGLAAWPGDPYMQMLVERREKGRADVSPALADVALDERASTDARVAALAWLTRSGDHGVIPMIEPLEAAGDPAVREAAAKALARLRESRDLGLASHMRPPSEPRRP